MKTYLKAIPCLLASYSVTAETVNLDQLNRQLDIMNNIIQSSVDTSKGSEGVKLSSIESTYLQDQGVVFTVRSKSSFGHWGRFNFDVVMPPVEQMAPLSPDQISDIRATVEAVADVGDLDIGNLDAEREVAKTMEMASRTYERVIELHRGNREEYRELRDDLRDVAYDLRDIERESRNAEYQMKRAGEKEEKKELEKELKRLDKRKKELLASKGQLEQRTKEIKSKQVKQAQKQEQMRKDYYQSLSAMMAETLCLYGNGLKALPKGENVTVILKSGGDRVDRNYKDKIHVFSKRDINSCAVDKISVATLLEKSSAYQF
ncbi:MAG: hypothetical protein MK214_02120 [Thalassotalea sp.]|nr:hypothetical protein [Thalassotalea sp.]